MRKSIHNKPSAVAHRRALALWLKEWELDLALRDKIDAGPYEGFRAANQPGPKAGDIRLLPPAPVSVPAADRPVYILVLRPAGEKSFEVVPFGRFALPATPEEWLTGLGQAPLRVLCLWNICRVSAEALHGTWRVKAMPAAEMKKVLDIARADKNICGKSAARVGPPLINPLDPRYVYLAEERQLVNELLDGLKSACAEKKLVYEIPEPDKSLRLAAEKKRQALEDDEKHDNG